MVPGRRSVVPSKMATYLMPSILGRHVPHKQGSLLHWHDGSYPNLVRGRRLAHRASRQVVRHSIPKLRYPAYLDGHSGHWSLPT